MTARRLANTDACTRRVPESSDLGPTGSALAVRFEVRLLAGEAGRALAAAQGRALAALFASLGEAEVGQGEEVSP